MSRNDALFAMKLDILNAAAVAKYIARKNVKNLIGIIGSTAAIALKCRKYCYAKTTYIY